MKKYGIDDLVKAIKDQLPEGLPLYPNDIATDRPREFVFAEFIREKCMRLLKDEVPHSIYVEIKNIDEDETSVSITGKFMLKENLRRALSSEKVER